jgi:exodeoxyribonuclease-5
VRYALEEVGLSLRNICFAAYAIKAALVMRSQRQHTASTIHKLIYISVGPSPFVAEQARAAYEELREQCPHDMPPAVWKTRVRQLEQVAAEAGQVQFVINPCSAVREARLVVINECSMVGKEIAHDLLASGKPTLSVADPVQLPPIGSGRAPFLTSRPDAVLTEVHQAADNPIIGLATMVQQGPPIPYGQFGDSGRKMRKGTLDACDLVEADQVICGLHQTRCRVNNILKRAAGFAEPLPIGGTEKIIWLKNQHALGIFNVQFLRLDEVEEGGELSFLAAVSCDDGDDLGPQELYAGHFLDHVRFDKDRSWRDQWLRRDLVEAGWGWAITAHNAQASGWPHVVVIQTGAATRSSDASGFTPRSRAPPTSSRSSAKGKCRC